MAAVNHAVTVDFHAHVLSVELTDMSAETADPRWPRIVVDADDEEQGEVRLGDTVFRKVRRQLWDTTARLDALDQQNIDLQVISPIPIALTYWAPAAHALRFAREQNDEIARAVGASGGRLRGLGTVPLQDPKVAIAEMARVVDQLGLHGIEIGTVVGGAELDDPDLRPFFQAAAESSVPIFIHPTDGSGATRCSAPLLDFAIGMHTDTSLAAYALVYGGVLAELPDLRICLSHGGGAFPWTHPRLRVLHPSPNAELDALVARLWADVLVFDPLHLPLLVERFGPGHLVLGSDFPFIPEVAHDPIAELRRAHDLGLIDDPTRVRVRGANALAFLDR
jgi:aminocarboxymuconate-semialdehyde decarboxylase